jgi:hypothetical protein
MAVRSGKRTSSRQRSISFMTGSLSTGIEDGWPSR